jgi:hypothetical protein
MSDVLRLSVSLVVEFKRQEVVMKYSLKLTLVFLVLIGIAQSVRAIAQVEVHANNVIVPVWWSYVAAVFLFGLAAWLWKEHR